MKPLDEQLWALLALSKRKNADHRRKRPKPVCAARSAKMGGLRPLSQRTI